MKLAGALLAAAPVGKAQWIGASVVTALIGSAGVFYAVSERVASIPDMRVQLSQNTARIDVLEDSVNAGSRQRRRILCLSEISAAGEIVPVFQLARRCP